MNKKGFTLIELLVVISIIGVLSSLGAVSFKGKREKAQLANAQQFSASIRHYLGTDAVAIWEFEEGTGTIANDSSGYGNNGIIHDDEGADWVEGLVLGTMALRFDGINDYVEIPNCDSLFIRNNLVWEVWFKADTIMVVPRTIIQQGGNHNFLWLLGDEIWFNLPGISTSGVLKSNHDIQSGKWYHVLATYDGVKMCIYINGQLDSETATTGEDIGGADAFGNITTTISGISTPAFYGIIDKVRIYNGRI